MMGFYKIADIQYIAKYKMKRCVLRKSQHKAGIAIHVDNMLPPKFLSYNQHCALLVKYRIDKLQLALDIAPVI